MGRGGGYWGCLLGTGVRLGGMGQLAFHFDIIS